MKKQILTLAFITLVGAAVTITGCKKPDETAPVITLKGNAEQTIFIGDTYTVGATASDDKDGDISANITTGGTPVDANKAGVYTLTYDVSDAAGNAAAQVTQKVTVKVKNSNILGNWNTSESCSGAASTTFVATVSAGSTEVSFTVSNFGNYGGSVVVTGELSGATNTTITIPAQVVGGANFSGTGTVEPDAKKMTISYTATQTGQPNVSCTMTMTK